MQMEALFMSMTELGWGSFPGFLCRPNVSRFARLLISFSLHV